MTNLPPHHHGGSADVYGADIRPPRHIGDHPPGANAAAIIARFRLKAEPSPPFGDGENTDLRQ